MLDHRLAYVLKRLSGQRPELNFEKDCDDTLELAPARTAIRPAGIMLPGQLERARYAMPSTTLEFQKSVASGGPVSVPPTRVHTLRQARIEKASIYVSGKRKPLTGMGILKEVGESRKANLRTISRGLLVSTRQGLTYFGDWLFENSSRVLLAEELGEKAISMIRNPPYGHGAHYDHHLQLNYQKIDRAIISELLVVEDWGHHPEKAARYRVLRDRARQATGRDKGHDVFVVRGRSGQMRRLSNEDACIQWARERGFSIIDPTKMTVAELLHELRDARCVAGVEGSGLLHGLMAMASDGFLLAIVAADRFVVGSKEYADVIDIPVAMVVADKGDVAGFEVNIEELNATYELALASV